MGRFIRNWTDQLTILTNGPATLQPAHRQQLAALGVTVQETPVQRLVHEQDYVRQVELIDGMA